MCPGRGWCGHGGPSTGPTACALASRRCALWDSREGVPGGGTLRRCEGRLGSGARPPPATCPQGGLSGSATHLLRAWVCGGGGPALFLWLACSAGGCVPRGWWEAVPGSVAFQCHERCLVSGAVPLPAPHPWGRAARTRCPCVLGTGGVGMRDHSPPPQRALLRAGVAHCGGAGGRAQGGCLAPLWGASEVRRSSSPGCSSSGRAVGVRYPLAVGAAVRAWGPSNVPLACMPYGGLRAAGVVGGLPGGGRPSGVVRGVWCQALRISCLPVSGGGRREHVACLSRARVVWAWGTNHRHHSVRSCEPALRAVGGAGGRPLGGCLAPL